MHRPNNLLFPEYASLAFADGTGAPEPLWREEEEAIRQSVPSRQREFAMGRTCARRALVALGVAPQAIPVGPFRAPEWPEGIAGSITHCRGFVGAVVVRTGDADSIGFDAEPAEPLAPDLVSLICTRDERAWVAAAAPPRAANWEKVMFSAKEAVHKCIFPLFGQLLDFLDVAVAIEPARGTFTVQAATAGPAQAVALGRIAGHFEVTDRFIFTCAIVPPSAGRG